MKPKVPNESATPIPRVAHTAILKELRRAHKSLERAKARVERLEAMLHSVQPEDRIKRTRWKSPERKPT